MLKEYILKVPTPPYKRDNCHSELVSESYHPTLTLHVHRGKKAFTLAEVLITLVIIGVIAAITVPTLITKYQKEQTVTRLKKAYSAFAQTTNRAISDYGPINTWDIGSNNDTNAAKSFLNKYVLPYMSVSKMPTTSSEGQWIDKAFDLNGRTEFNYANRFVRFYLNDGTSVSVNFNTEKAFRVHVDINGDKKPNKLGKDIFVFNYNLDSGKFYPIGANQTRENLLEDYGNRCNKNCTGESCAALIMKDGWRIADDYPW